MDEGANTKDAANRFNCSLPPLGVERVKVVGLFGNIALCEPIWTNRVSSSQPIEVCDPDSVEAFETIFAAASRRKQAIEQGESR